MRQHPADPDSAWLVAGRAASLVVGPERALAGHPDIRGRVHLTEPVLDLGPVLAEHRVAESGVRDFTVPWHELADGRTVAAHPVGGTRSLARRHADRARRQPCAGRPPHLRPRAVRAAPPDHPAARGGPGRSLDPRGRGGRRYRGGRGGRTHPRRQDPAGQPPDRSGPGRRRRRRRLPRPRAGGNPRDAGPQAARGRPRDLPTTPHAGAADRRRDAGGAGRPVTAHRFLERTARPWPAPWLPTDGVRALPALPDDVAVLVAPAQDESAFADVADLVSALH